MDSDDLWYKEKLTEIKKKLIQESMIFIITICTLKIKQKDIKIKAIHYSQKNINIKFDDLIVNGNDIIQSSVVVKKKFISKIDIFLKKNHVFKILILG